MGSVLICGPQQVSRALTQQFKSMGVRSYTICHSHYLDPNTVCIAQDLFTLTSKDIPPVSLVYYQPSLPIPSITLYRRAYLHGLAHLLSIIPSETKVVFGSSEKVYGDKQGLTVDENTPITSMCPISQTLVSAEKLLSNSKMPHTIIRLGTVYTDHQQLISRIRQQKIGYSQRQNFMNFIHLNDLVRALIQTIHHTGTFVVSDCSPIPLNTVLSLLSSKTGLSVALPRKHIPCSKGVKMSPAKLLALGFDYKHSSFLQSTAVSYSE